MANLELQFRWKPAGIWYLLAAFTASKLYNLTINLLLEEPGYTRHLELGTEQCISLKSSGGKLPKVRHAVDEEVNDLEEDSSSCGGSSEAGGSATEARAVGGGTVVGGSGGGGGLVLSPSRGNKPLPSPSRNFCPGQERRFSSLKTSRIR